MAISISQRAWADCCLAAVSAGAGCSGRHALFISNLRFRNSASAGPDPHVWSWFNWVIMLGPLLGYGFLAGATLRVPDDPGRAPPAFARLLARRAVWVAIGPWWGAIVCVGRVFCAGARSKAFSRHAVAPAAAQSVGRYRGWHGPFLDLLAFTWLLIVWPVSGLMAGSGRQLRRWGGRRESGNGKQRSFAASSWPWRLSARFSAASGRRPPCGEVISLMLASCRWCLLAVSLAVISGCAGRITYGEMRRRELFHAMLVAWVLGLALMWRWWSRSRRQHP